MNIQTDSPLINTITPNHVTAFLQRKGWIRQDFPNNNLLVFNSPMQDDVPIVIPSQVHFVDYSAKLQDCIQFLSVIYNIDVSTLIHQIAHWDRDVITIRINSPFDKEQLPPLNFASQMISKYRDFVAFAAATEIEPRKFFTKLTNSGKKFVEHCMFGHTFIGSFGITIECPLDIEPELQIPDAPPARPFKRAVTERIATGYIDVAKAIEADDPDIIIQNHKMGFSGNMCEILNDIYKISERREISNNIIWCPEIKPSEHLLVFDKPFSLDERSSKILKVAAEALQTVEEPDIDKVIQGRITRLRSEKPPLESKEFKIASRTIVILWDIEKNQSLHIHIQLPLSQYREACDAHKNAHMIRVVGKPKKIGKFWHLLDHHNFEIV